MSANPPAVARALHDTPNYAWVPPVTPIEYGEAGLFSIAVSYDKSPFELQAFLIDRRPAELRPRAENGASGADSPRNFGTLRREDGKRIEFIRAELRCSTELVCPRGPTGIHSLLGPDPAYWEWLVNAASNEDKTGGLQVLFEGGIRADGKDFAPIEQIPPIQMAIKIRWSPLQALEHYVDAYKSILEGLLAILVALAGLRAWLTGKAKGTPVGNPPPANGG